MRHSEKVDEKVKGWEVTGVLAEGRAGRRAVTRREIRAER